MASGLDRIAESLKKHRAEIILTIAALGTAESKWKAIGGLVKDIAVWRMVGPLGVVLGTVTGIATAMRSVLRETGSLEAAIKRLSQIKGLEKQFEGLIRNATIARQRVAELVQLADKGFKLEQWGAAGRSLEIFTRGAYAGAAALKEVGDAAKATDNAVEDVAFGVGELYSALREGKPVAETAKNLRNMGVISTDTARRVAELQASGAAFETMWGTVQADLRKASGAMEEHSKTVEGLQAKYDKVRGSLAQKFGQPFAEAERQNLERGVAILSSLGPVVEQTSRYFASLLNPVSDTASKIGAWVAQLSGVQQVVATAAKGLITFTAVLGAGAAALGLWKLGAFIAMLVRVAVTGTASAAGMTAYARAVTAAQASVAALTVGNLRLAGSQALVAARSGTAAAAMGTMGLVMKALPWIAIITAVTSLIQIFSDWRAATEETKRVVEETEKNSKDLVSTLRAQAAAMTTLEDKTRALADANNALAAAYREYFEVASKPFTRLEIMKGDRDKQLEAKEAAITTATRERDMIAGAGGLEPTERELNLARQRREREEREREELFAGRMDRALPGEQLVLRGQKISELDAKARMGIRGNSGRAATERARMGIAGEISGAEAELAKRVARAQQVSTSTASQAEIDEARGDVFAQQRVINSLRARSERLGLNSGSQSLALETRANMMDAGRQLGVARLLGAEPAEIDRLEQLSGGLNGTPAQTRALRERAARARVLEETAGENLQRAGGLREQQRTQEIEVGIVARREQMELRIAELKGRGVQRAEEELRIRSEYLDKEMAMERAKRSPDQNQLTRLAGEQAEIARSLQETRRSGAVNELGVERRLTTGAAERLGLGAVAIGQGDLDRFASTYEEMLGQGFSPAQSRQFAQQLTLDDIFRSAADGDRGGVADSLQRIGGGGGVGRDPVLSVAERQANLQQEMVGYLRTLAERSGADVGLPEEDGVFGD